MQLYVDKNAQFKKSLKKEGLISFKQTQKRIEIIITRNYKYRASDMDIYMNVYLYIYILYECIYINNFRDFITLKVYKQFCLLFQNAKLTKDHPSIIALLLKKKKERNTFPEKVTL